MYPDNLFCYYSRAHAKTSMGDYAGAIRDYNKISIDPKFVLTYIERGHAKRHLSDPSGAIRDFSMALSLEPEYFLALNYRGYTKYISGDIAGAIRDYKRIIKNKQNNKSSSNKEMFETIQSHMQQLNNLAETILPAINDVRTTVQGMSGSDTFGQMAVGGDSSVHKYSPNKKYQDFHY